jgi:hypothetical protein
MTWPTSRVNLAAPVRGGLLWLGSLLALVLAANLASAQPPEHPAGEPRERAADSNFARRGKLSAPPAEPFDITDARRVEWGNPRGGVWSDPANWNGGELPGEDEVAVLDMPGTYEVLVDADAIIGALRLEGGEGSRTVIVRRSSLKIRGASRVAANDVLHLDGGILTGSGDLEIAGHLRWSAGSMSGAGTTRIAPSGRLTLEGARRKVLSLRVLENAGHAEWRGTGAWVVTFDSVVRNLADGELTISATGLLDLYGPPGPLLENAGLLRKTTVAAITVEPPFRNRGRVVVEKGSLELLAGYVQTGGTTVVAAGAAIRSPAGFDIEGGTVEGEGSFPQLAAVVEPQR